MSERRAALVHTLLVLAIVICGASLSSAIWHILVAERRLASDVRESLVYTVAENEHELLRFLDALNGYSSGYPPVSREEFVRRFDLLWSRVFLLHGGELGERMARLPDVAEVLAQARETLVELEPLVMALPAGRPMEAAAVAQGLRELRPLLHQATINTMAGELQRLTTRGEERERSLWMAATYLLGLVGGGVVLIVLLFGEIRRRTRLADLAATAEAAALTSEQRFRDIVEAASDWVWETDADHRFTMVSARLKELSGEAPDSVLGRRRIDLRLPGDEDDANWAGHQAQLDGRRPFRDFVFPYLDTAGRRRWARIHGRPVFGAAGNFLGYRGTGRDITTEREAAQALSESRELLRAVVDAVPAVINVKDREARYVLMNRFQGEAYGVDPAAAIGHLSAEFTGPEYGSQSEAFDRQVIASGVALPFMEREFTNSAGQRRIWWTAKEPLRGPDGEVRYVLTVALDITGLKAAERARANLSRYFSPNMVEVLAARDQPIGQVRQQDVAVVFADLVNFTSLSARETPVRTMALLRELLARLTEIVLQHGGTLEKFLGDGLMATFGTPISSGRDAVNALDCICAIAAAMTELNEARRQAGELPLKIGVGGHFGPVILGEVGSESRVEFAVVGDTVNVANRMEELTRRLAVPAVVSRSLVEAARQERGSQVLDAFMPAGAEYVAGHEEPIEVWVLAEPPATDPAAATAPAPRMSAVPD